jgi:hypothetical protein
LQFVTGEDVDGRPAPAMTVWRAPALIEACFPANPNYSAAAAGR